MPSPKRSNAAHVVVIGAGGIGCGLLPLLAVQHGIARLTVVDGDTVEPRNLPRQLLFGPVDVGRSKVEVAVERLRHLAAELDVHYVPQFLDAATAERVFAEASLVADCTDDLHAHRMIDAYCGERSIPLVTGSVHTTQVQVMTLHVPRSDGFGPVDLATFYPGKPGPDQDGCDMRDVPVTVTTMAATLMAWRIADILSGGSGGAEYMDLVDLGNGKWFRLTPPRPAGVPDPSIGGVTA